MNEEALRRLLQDLHAKSMTPEQALEQLKTLPFENLEFAHLDHHRNIRTGLPEVIYCEGKTGAQIAKIIHRMETAGHDVLATRLSPELYRQVQDKLPKEAVYHEISRTLVVKKQRVKPKIGNILVITAGTSDIPVAEETAVTADLLGSHVEKIYDVGVAGLHRLLDKLEVLRRARVLVVVAGMDGALTSVVGGLVHRPVIGVPTSVGYGTAFQGVSALLTMLNSCAAGIGTVNIDNGFGAGCLAHRINLLGEPEDA